MKVTYIGILVIVAWMASPVSMLLAHWWSESSLPFLHFYALWCDSINGNAYAIYKAVTEAAADSKMLPPGPTATTFIGGAIVVGVGATLAYIVLFFIPNWVILFIASFFL